MAKFIVKGSIKETDIIELSEDVNEKNVTDVKDKFLMRIKGNIKNIILLCKGLKRVDSSGASLLTEISHLLEQKQGKLFLVNCPSSVEILIKFMGVDHLFQFYKTEEEVCNILGISHQDFLFSSTGRALKRQISLRDNLRNQTIIVQYSQSMTVAEIIEYLRKNYVHLRTENIYLAVNQAKLIDSTTITELFNKHNYSQKNVIQIEKEVAEDVKTITPAQSKEKENFASALMNQLTNSDGLTGEGTVVGENDQAQEEYIDQQHVEIQDSVVYKEKQEISTNEALPNFLKQTIGQLHKIEKSLELILELTKTFSNQQNLDDTLYSILETIHSFTPYAYGVTLLYDRKAGELVTKSIKNNEEDSYQKTMISKSLLQNTEEKRKMTVVTPENTERHHLAIPILSGKQLLGIVYLISYDTKKYKQETLIMLSAIINYSALAIENMLLINQLDSALND